MRNCKNMYSNAQMEFLRKRDGQQRYLNQLYGSPLNISNSVTLKYGEFPILCGFINRYVNANIYLKKAK